MHMSDQESLQLLLAQAIFTVNKHAKTAPNPSFLYKLKKMALHKLIENGLAKKEGLHFSKNPRFSKQQSDVIVKVGNYYFHMPPSKEDFTNLPHLGTLNSDYRNPKTKMSLSYAKKLLCNYTGLKEEVQQKKSTVSTLGMPLSSTSSYSFHRKRK
ncbi:MAG: YkyB family protein [Bacillaceae bacterium]